MAYKLVERPRDFSVYPVDKRVQQTTIKDGVATVETMTYQQVFGAHVLTPSVFDARYEGDDEWNIDLDCGAQRWNGTQTTEQVRKAMLNLNFHWKEIKRVLKKYKDIHAQEQAEPEAPRTQRGDKYAHIKAQVRLLDSTTWKVIDRDHEEFVKVYGPLNYGQDDRYEQYIPVDIITEIYSFDDVQGIGKWRKFQTSAGDGHRWSACWKDLPKNTHLRPMTKHEAVDSAQYWHSSMYDSIYAFSSTGCVQSEEHREGTIQSIRGSIAMTIGYWPELPLVWTQDMEGGPNAKADLQTLIRMLLYVMNAPIESIDRKYGG